MGNPFQSRFPRTVVKLTHVEPQVFMFIVGMGAVSDISILALFRGPVARFSPVSAIQNMALTDV